MDNKNEKNSPKVRKEIAEILRSADQISGHKQGPLAALGIDVCIFGSFKAKKSWSRLLSVLISGDQEDKEDKEDGLILFDALSRSIKGSDPRRATDLMHIALAHAWRLEAMTMHPVIFGGSGQQKIPTKPFKARSRMSMSNPFYVLAKMPATDESARSMSFALRQLNAIGVARPKSSPNKEAIILHLATESQGPDALRAFAEHLPEQLGERDRMGRTALHLAAMRGDPRCVKVLLEAGANPLTLTRMGDSALDEAVKARRIEAVHSLCGQPGQDQWSIRRAKSWAASADMKAYMDSALARLEIEKVILGLFSLEEFSLQKPRS